MFKRLKLKLTHMPKSILIHLVIIVALIMGSSLMLYKSCSKPEIYPQSITRGGVDITDTTFKMIAKEAQATENITTREENSFDFEKFMAGLMALGFAWLSYNNTKKENKADEHQKNIASKLEQYQNENTDQHTKIVAMVETVIALKDKEGVIKELDRIMNNIIQIPEDIKIQTLLESMKGRTQSFVMDIMTDELTPELYDYAVIKMNIKCKEALNQVNELDFSSEFIEAFKILQVEHVVKLRQELYDIMKASIINHKYVRFGEAVENFLLTYGRDVLRLYNKIELRQLIGK